MATAIDAASRHKRATGATPGERASDATAGGEAVLYDAHPKMFRNAPFAFAASVLAIGLAGIGVIILLVWWLKCLTDRLTITPGKVVWRHGLLARSTVELDIAGIRSVRVHQTVTQRILDTGTVSIFTAGDEPELTIHGLPDPERIRALIDEQRRS